MINNFEQEKRDLEIRIKEWIKKEKEKVEKINESLSKKYNIPLAKIIQNGSDSQPSFVLQWRKYEFQPSISFKINDVEAAEGVWKSAEFGIIEEIKAINFIKEMCCRDIQCIYCGSEETELDCEYDHYGHLISCECFCGNCARTLYEDAEYLKSKERYKIKIENFKKELENSNITLEYFHKLMKMIKPFQIGE